MQNAYEFSQKEGEFWETELINAEYKILRKMSYSPCKYSRQNFYLGIMSVGSGFKN